MLWFVSRRLQRGLDDLLDLSRPCNAVVVSYGLRDAKYWVLHKQIHASKWWGWAREASCAAQYCFKVWLLQWLFDMYLRWISCLLTSTIQLHWDSVSLAWWYAVSFHLYTPCLTLKSLQATHLLPWLHRSQCAILICVQGCIAIEIAPFLQDACSSSAGHFRGVQS